MEFHGRFNLKIFIGAFLFVEVQMELTLAGKGLWISSFLYYFLTQLFLPFPSLTHLNIRSHTTFKLPIGFPALYSSVA